MLCSRALKLYVPRNGDIEICCAPNCSNSSMIWEREIDREWTINTSLSSRSPSCNFPDDRPPLGFAYVCFSAQYLYHTDFAVFTVTQLVCKLCKTPRNITRNSVTSFTDNFVKLWCILNLDRKGLLNGRVYPNLLTC